VPFRVIAERKGMSLGAVQKAHARALKPEEEARREELDSIVAYDDGGPYCEDVTDPAQVPLLTDLELYRLRFLPAGHPAHAAVAAAVAAGWRWPVSPPIVYPVGEGAWRNGVDRVMADDSGVADDW
jgi:hypothetical protein